MHGMPARHHCTAEKVFESDETEFLIAMEKFKNRSGKKFPTWCDTLGVLKSLGYKRHESLLTLEEALAG